MEAEEIEKRDSVFEFLEERGRCSSYSICKEFFPNHLSGDPHRQVRKVLSVDPRFHEVETGQWEIHKFQGVEQDAGLNNQRYCVFDLETTGGVPPLHRIIEIGAVLLENGEVIKEFECLVNPGRPLPEYVGKLTGIQEKDLEEGIEVEDALLKFDEFSRGAVLVAHNASFDVNFVRFEFQRTLNRDFDRENLCTLKLSKFLVRESRAHKLEAMAEYFEVKLEERHRALTDARMTANILLCLIERLKKLNIKTFRSARKFGINPRDHYFPDCLTTPEELETIPDSPGVTYFFSETGKRLHAWPMESMQGDLKSLIYEGMSRTPFIKRLLKRSSRFEVEEHPSYLHSLLTATRYARQKGRDGKNEDREFYYLKAFSPTHKEIFITNRKLRDQAVYLGPFDSADRAKSLLKGDFQKGNLQSHRFPPKSGIEQVFETKKNDLSSFLQKHSLYSNKAANLFIIARGEDSTVQVSIIREGYLFKKRWLDLEKLDQNAVENFFREVLKAYFKERSVNEMLSKLKPSRVKDYDVIMHWLVHHSQEDKNCVVRVLRNAELNSLKESLVQKLANELIMSPFSDIFAKNEASMNELSEEE